MPGPMSAPNGDRSLQSSEKVACEKHGSIKSECFEEKCFLMTKREQLLRRNRLRTGKTR